MRRVVVAMVGAAIIGLSGCDKPKERPRDEAAIAAAIDPDDHDRRPEHRFAVISKRTGCY